MPSGDLVKTEMIMEQRKRVIWVFLGATAVLGSCSESRPTETASLNGTGEGSGAGRNGEDLGPTEEPGEFGSEQTYVLRLNDTAPPPVTLELNRDEVTELFGERANEITLVVIDTTTLLTESLERIKNACGPFWQEDAPEPRHDCSLTELGQTFVGPDGTWQTSAEFALVRLLTMTPANVDVTGTSSESLRELADALGIGGGYSQILSDALGIARTDVVVSTASLVESFKENLVGTHPNAGDDATLAISLKDALTDLSTLSERYGPTGSHPGVIDPSVPPSGAVLGPDFTLRVVAESNLRLCDAIDGDLGKGFLSVVADEIGPTFEDELEFEFENPSKFSISGLVENLTVDLRLRALEAGQFVPSCLGARCQGNAPGMPLDNSSVWAVDPWLLEHTIAAGARNDYIERTFDGRYLLGLASVSLGPTPPGWISYGVPLNLGDPPEDQYVWETILEVAQVALHDTPFATIAEGAANVAFTLSDVPVGLTGTEAAERVRPQLQEQRSALSNALLGDYKKNSDTADFYYRRAESGVPHLFFVAPADMKDGQAYAYEHPGFFRTSKLEGKLSGTQIPGLSDTTHEKLAIVTDETTVYFQDENGITHRTRILRDSASEDLEVQLARKAQ
jgi:hypothetical protein